MRVLTPHWQFKLRKKKGETETQTRSNAQAERIEKTYTDTPGLLGASIYRHILVDGN